VPIYTDFTQWGVAWLQALNGQTTSLYDPTEVIKIQTAPAGPGVIDATWPYPPTLLLILAPLAALPYVAAFLVWHLLTSAGCIGTVYLIVRRLPEIALVLALACPFTAVKFCGRTKWLFDASMFGAALLFLERSGGRKGVTRCRRRHCRQRRLSRALGHLPPTCRRS